MQWLQNLAIRFLERHGWLVVPSRYHMLIVSGNALAVYDETHNYWIVNYPVPRGEVFLGAFKNSVITTRGGEVESH